MGRAGDVIATGGVELVSGIARHPAQFSVTGEPNATVSIATPVPSSIILANGLGDTMSINGLGVDPSQPLDGTGSLIFRIGGNLGVGANQAAGTYTGTFVVTVNYE